MKTYSAKAEEIARGWFLVDAQGKVLGHLVVMDNRPRLIGETELRI